MLRTVIVDDEPPARELLVAMLAPHADVEVVAEYRSGSEAARGLAADRPDLVFLDVQMPGRTGLQVAAELTSCGAPAVVFVTAYDQYAVRAFELHALDYLLKPFSAARLAETVARARTHRLHPAADARVAQAVEMLLARGGETRRIAIRVGERTYLRRAEEVEWVEADAKVVRIHLGGAAYAMRETMKCMEERLDPARFVRVSRSAIVNLDRVVEIQPWFNGDLMLILESGAQVTTTRGYRDRLREVLGRGA
jgi:two-component system LytT family response regulator